MTKETEVQTIENPSTEEGAEVSGAAGGANTHPATPERPPIETHPSGDYEFHPATNIFPLLEGADFDALVADIRQHGLQDPITLDTTGRLIIDGRNRQRACLKTRVEPRFVNRPADSKGSDLDFLIGANLHRRHLTNNQRAMAAAKLADLKPHEKKGDRSNDPSAPSAISQQDAAKRFHVSVPSVKRAKAVVSRGTSELVAVTEKGIIPLALAKSVAELPRSEQDKVAAECRQQGSARPAREAVSKAPNTKVAAQADSAVVPPAGPGATEPVGE